MSGRGFGPSCHRKTGKDGGASSANGETVMISRAGAEGQGANPLLSLLLCACPYETAQING